MFLNSFSVHILNTGRPMMNTRLHATSAAVCAALYSLDVPADQAGLARLFNMPPGELAGCLEELSGQDLLCIDDEADIHLSGSIGEQQIRDLVGKQAGTDPGSELGRAIFAYYSGRKQDFFQSARIITHAARNGGDIVSARCLYGILSNLLVAMPIDPGDRGEASAFLAASSLIQKVMQLFPWQARSAIELYNRMESLAERCGDRRTLCWIKLSKGLLNINMGNDSHAQENFLSMRDGLQLINELGDSNIIIQSSGMVCFYHFMEGEFTKAVNCGYSCLYMNESVNVDYERLLFAYAGLSAIALGQHDVAVSILSRAISRARSRKAPLNVDGLEAILSYAFLMMHEDEKAIGLIDRLLEKAASSVLTYATFTAAKVLAYHYFSKGKIRQAHSILLNWLPKTDKHGLVHSNCLAMPFMLEMLGEFQRCGLPQLFSSSVFQEIESALSSPSKVLRAVAYREKAMFSWRGGGDAPGAAMEYLRQSLSILHSVFAPGEQCKTLQAMARISLGMQQEASAREFAAEAWGLHSGNRYIPWPEDLRFLVGEGKTSPLPSATPAEILMRVMQSMRQQYTWETPAEFFRSLLCSLMTALNLAKGGMFRCDGETTLLADAGLGADDPHGPAHAAQQKLLDKAHALHATVWKTLPPADGRNAISIAMFLKTEGLGDYLIFMEGESRGGIMDILGRSLFSLLEDFCITEITMFLKSVELWKGQFRRERTQASLVREPELFYQSPAMKHIVEQVDLLARTDTTILILGESGVGKELVARRLHEQSGRSGDFIAVNIASTPEDLFESEFYGHEKGSFTGANYQKRGLFELADKGTLFIDEAGDIPPFLQVKLLRVLQEHTFMRVGGTRPLHADFRLVAATNRDLKEAVRKGTFREDLYYRLSVVPVSIPPLRERPEDILYLARTFLRDYAAKDATRASSFPESLEKSMLSYDWPGNVRELKNFVERFSLMPDQSIVPSRIMLGRTASSHPSAETHLWGRGKAMTLAELQDRYFEHLYAELNGAIGGKNGLAAVLGMSRTTAYAWIERLGLKNKYEKKLLKK